MGFPGADRPVSSVVPQSDGKVLISGEFRGVNGVVRNGIRRLNADGSLDTSFGNGLSGTSNPVECMALQQDGRVLVGGFFTAANGLPAAYVARLWGSADVPPRIMSIARSVAQADLTWEAIPGRTYQVHFKPALSETGWTALTGDITASDELASKTDISLGDHFQRFYRVMLLP